jgi:hypothetical protein
MNPIEINTQSWHYRCWEKASNVEPTSSCDYVMGVWMGLFVYVIQTTFFCGLAAFLIINLYKALAFDIGMIIDHTSINGMMTSEPVFVGNLLIGFVLVAAVVIAIARFIATRPEKVQIEKEPGPIKLAWEAFTTKVCRPVKLK